MNQVPFGPAREASGFGFIICYCSYPEELGNSVLFIIWLGGLANTATSPSVLGLGSIGPTKALMLASDTGAEPFFLGEVPGASIELS
jgi:hypothetical protein